MKLFVRKPMCILLSLVLLCAGLTVVAAEEYTQSCNCAQEQCYQNILCYA